MGCAPLSGVVEAISAGGPGRRERAAPASPPDAPPADRGRRAGWPSSAPRRAAMLDHVDDNGGQATAGSARHTVLPEDAATPAEELLAAPAAGAARRRRRASCPARSGWRCAAAAPPASRWTRVPEIATSRARPGAGRPGRGRRGVRGGPPRRAAARPLGHRAAGRAAQRRARRARPQGGAPPCCTSTSRRRRCWSRWPHAAGLLATGADAQRRPGLAADRRVRRVDRARPWPSGGCCWSAPGSRRRGCPAWSASATPAARPERARPELSSVIAAETRRMALRGAGRRCRRARCSRPAPASRPWSPGSPGCGRAGRAPAPTRSCGRSTEAAALGLLGLGGLSTSYVASLLAGEDEPRPRPRWRRCCPSRSTTC